MSARSLMTNRYGVSAFSFVTFLPCSVRPIVKPGPTVPVTVFGAAAEPLPAATSAAAPIAASKTAACVMVLMSFASSRSGWGNQIVGRRPGDSHRGDPPEFAPAPAVHDRISDLGDYVASRRRCPRLRWATQLDFVARGRPYASSPE